VFAKRTLWTVQTTSLFAFKEVQTDLPRRQRETQREDAQVRQEAAPGPRLPSTDPAVTLSLLREAAADRHRVWIGHADAAGKTAKLLFTPRRVEGGRAYGTVAGSAVERSFSVHRITGVAPA